MELTGIVIAGGKSKRMGKDKLSMQFNGQSLIQQAVNLLEKYSVKTFVSANKSQINSNYAIINDDFADIGPIAGIYAGLKQAKTQKILIIPVDMPLLNEELISYLINEMDSEASINVFKSSNNTQMLIGIYDKMLMPIIENQIKEKQYKLLDLLDLSSSKLIDGQQFDALFTNTNTPKEWQIFIEQYEKC